MGKCYSPVAQRVLWGAPQGRTAHLGLDSAMVRHLLAGARLLGYRAATLTASDGEQVPLALAPHHIGGLGRSERHQHVAVHLGESSR